MTPVDMESREHTCHHPVMYQSPIQLLRRRDWRDGTTAVRRELEIRYVLGAKLRARRRAAGLTQARLAAMLGVAPSTICKLERFSLHVSIDVFVRAMIRLGADDLEIGLSFLATAHVGVQRLRERGELPFLRAADVPYLGPRKFIFGR